MQIISDINIVCFQIIKLKRYFGMEDIEMQRKKYYQLFLVIVLILDIVVSFLYYIWYLDKRIPTSINIVANSEESFNFNLPVKCENTSNTCIKVMSNPGTDGRLKVTAGNDYGSCKAELKLFGIIHYKNIKFNVVKKQKLMPSGRAVGIYVNARGVMVLGTANVHGKDGVEYSPAKNILQTGDYIYQVDGKNVSSIEDIENILQNRNKAAIQMKVRRGKEKIDVKMKCVEADDGNVKIGTWLREDTEGIGTITYITSDNMYAALGHGIADADTGLLVDISAGGLYKADVGSVIPSKKGSPGQISGSVELSDKCRIGSIATNQDSGIKGEMITGAQDYVYQKKNALPIAFKQEIKKGKAYIICQLGKQTGKYEVDICGIYQNAKENKDMVIKVTDKRLLNKTGGIVQGMSGSPIIQNGRLVGAVTHVFVNDPEKGYGIFIERMLS